VNGYIMVTWRLATSTSGEREANAGSLSPSRVVRQGCDFGVDLKVPEMMTDDPPRDGRLASKFLKFGGGM
jgi:hypothetical protein